MNPANPPPKGSFNKLVENRVSFPAASVRGESVRGTTIVRTWTQSVHGKPSVRGYTKFTFRTRIPLIQYVVVPTTTNHQYYKKKKTKKKKNSLVGGQHSKKPRTKRKQVPVRWPHTIHSRGKEHKHQDPCKRTLWLLISLDFKDTVEPRHLFCTPI